MRVADADQATDNIQKLHAVPRDMNQVGKGSQNFANICCKVDSMVTSNVELAHALLEALVERCHVKVAVRPRGLFDIPNRFW